MRFVPGSSEKGGTLMKSRREQAQAVLDELERRGHRVWVDTELYRLVVNRREHLTPEVRAMIDSLSDEIIKILLPGSGSDSVH